jgi:transcriptional regulator with XRE-family HTH domain
MPNSLHNNIRELRKYFGLSLEVFAGRIGVTYQLLSKWELGKHKPSFGYLLKICEEFKVSANWILWGEGPMFRGEERTPEKRFNFSDKLSDKEKRDLLRMIDSDDGIGRVLYTLLNHRHEERPVEEERRRS